MTINPLSNMNPLVAKSIGAIVRNVLAVTLGAYFVGKGIWTEQESNEYITAFLAVAIPTAWSLHQKWKSQRTENTTLAVANQLTGPNVDDLTAANIADVIKKGDAAPAMTPKDEAPTLTGTGDGVRLIRNITGTGSGA